MSELINALSNPGSMGQAQWLVLAVAAFIVVGSMYFVWKLYKLLIGVGKTSYKPNIGMSRTGYRPASSRRSDYKEDDKAP